jgi:hypothetical protein
MRLVEQHNDSVTMASKRNYEPTPPLAPKGIAIAVTATTSPPRNKQRPVANWSPRRTKWQLVAAPKHSLAGKQCETCGDKTANYGVAQNMFRKQWCKTCGLKHGAINSGIARGAGGFSGYARSEKIASEFATQQTRILEAFELCAHLGAKTATTTDSQQEKSSNRSLVESDTEIVSAASTDDAEYDQWFSEWQQDEEGQH